MSRPSVIVVEDDPDLGNAILDIAEMALDVDIELIGDGLKAQERFQVFTPRLILMDLHLPKVSGIELLRQNIDLWHSSGAKIIVMTADLTLISQIQELADCCLTKPFTVEKLIETFNTLLPPEPTPNEICDL